MRYRERFGKLPELRSSANPFRFFRKILYH